MTIRTDGTAFSLNRLRVTVDRGKLAQIADILGVSGAQRDRIISEGIVITTSSPRASGTARGAQARTARSATASRTPRRRK